MRRDYIDYPLKNSWINVLKAFLKGYNHINLEDSLPKGFKKKGYYQDLYYLPEIVQTNYPELFKKYTEIEEKENTINLLNDSENNITKYGDRTKDILFFRKLSDDILEKTGSIVSVKNLIKYHFNIYSGNTNMKERYFRGDNQVAFSKYIEKSGITNEIAPENKEIDWWKFASFCGVLLCSLLCLLVYFQKQDESYERMVAAYKNDKYGTFIDTLNNPQELEGTWYSINKSNEPKIDGDKFPFCRVKWNFKKDHGRILIERTYQDHKQTITNSFGIAEKIREVYHFHINVRDQIGIASKRHFICNLIPGNKKKLECLCTMYNTQTATNEHLLVGREILIFSNDTTMSSKNITSLDLDDDVKKYFPESIPGYLQMIEKDSNRFKEWCKPKK